MFRVFSSDLERVISAKGSQIFTERKTYFDLTGGGTSYAILGWNHPEINLAIQSQLLKFSHMDYKIWNDPNLEILAEIILLNKPGNLEYLYFAGNSGAEACEAAMKMSFQVHNLERNSSKKWFISRKQSYHGSTADALALGDRPNLEFYRTMLSPYRCQVSMHHFKKCREWNESEEEYAKRCADELEDKIIELGPENVAGFVGETIMGGLVGDVPPVGGYWGKIEAVCRKYNVHLILDEVYCGTGTTGSYFAFEQDKISPDFVFNGKTLAAGFGCISTVATTEKIHTVIRGSKDSRLQHTTTHQGFALSVAAAVEAQKIIRKEGFLDSVTEKGLKFRQALHQKLSDHQFFVDIRGRGLRFSFEHSIPDQVKFGDALENFLKQEYGMLVNAKWHRVCFTPNLLITDEEIENYSEKFVDGFRQVARKF